MTGEKRKFYRLPKKTQVTCRKIDFDSESASPDIVVESRNISAKGLMLVSEAPFDLDALLKVSITLPLMHKHKPGFFKPMLNPFIEPVTVIGKVVRIERLPDNRFEIGLVFEGIYEDDFVGLLKYIDKGKEDA